MRGAKGGFYFIKDPQRVSLYELMELIEGPLPVDGCLFEHQRCKSDTCKFRTLSAEVREVTERSLRKMTLAQFVGHSPGR
jgi:DNA-binding IscR family transcriptional regulator